jgi:hypothetical protein
VTGLVDDDDEWHLVAEGAGDLDDCVRVDLIAEHAGRSARHLPALVFAEAEAREMRSRG